MNDLYSRVSSLLESMPPQTLSDVVQIRFDLGTDAMGGSAVFFKVVLTDEAASGDRLRVVTQRVSLALLSQFGSLLDAMLDENRLRAYFTFRSRSEVESMKDPDWKLDFCANCGAPRVVLLVARR